MLSVALPMKKRSRLTQRAPRFDGFHDALTGMHPKIATSNIARNQQTMNVATR